jgi:hypothetical protein
VVGSRWLYYSSESEVEKHFGTPSAETNTFKWHKFPAESNNEKSAKAPASSFRNERWVVVRKISDEKVVLFVKAGKACRQVVLRCDLDDFFLILEVLGRGNIILQNK